MYSKMFQKLAKMSIIASAVTLQSFNGNDLAHFIILFQNSGSADFTDWCELILHRN